MIIKSKNVIFNLYRYNKNYFKIVFDYSFSNNKTTYQFLIKKNNYKLIKCFILENKFTENSNETDILNYFINKLKLKYPKKIPFGLVRYTSKFYSEEYTQETFFLKKDHVKINDYRDNKLHSTSYFKCNDYHNDKGPAIIQYGSPFYKKTKYYYFNDKLIDIEFETNKEYKKYLKLINIL